jgi:kinetochore protein Mis13/DSN1
LFGLARAIQDQLLKDFGARSEFSDWFAREDAPKPPIPVVLQPNPRNVDYDAKIAELEARIERYVHPLYIHPSRKS